MSVPTCPHEIDVVRAVTSGTWTTSGDDRLGRHVRDCAVCRDVAAMATLLGDADGDADIEVPTAAQMWWRLAVRSRVERERAAARPVVWLQGLAAATGVGLVAGVLGWLGPRLDGVAEGATERVWQWIPSLMWAATPTSAGLPVLAMLLGGALLAALVTAMLYVWLADD